MNRHTRRRRPLRRLPQTPATTAQISSQPTPWLAGAVADLVMEVDRAWFAAHPADDAYHRRAIPGEWPDDAVFPGFELMVEVRLLGPGVRARIPYAVLAEVPT